MRTQGTVYSNQARKADEAAVSGGGGNRSSGPGPPAVLDMKTVSSAFCTCSLLSGPLGCKAGLQV